MIAHLEPLEDRLLFAKLVLNATVNSDSVGLDVKNGRLWYTLNGVTQKLRAAGVAVVQLYLSNGNDKLILGSAAPVVYTDCGIGNDRVLGGSATKSMTVLGGNGNDSLVGGSGNDSLDGGHGNDTLIGGAGGDVLNGSYGADRFNSVDDEFDNIDGGADFDSASLNFSDAFVRVEDRQYA